MSRIHRIRFKTDNCYLVVNGNDAMLVDTASGEGYDKVLEECSRYNMKLIVLTHVHFDHAENAAKLAKHFNIPVACHEADMELFDSYDKQPLMSYGLVGKVVLDMSLKVLRNTKVDKPENIISVKDGDSLASYGFDARIIGMPGHTKGSIGVDVGGKDLIVGDALDNWISPATGHLYSDLDEIIRTADRIKAMGERTLYYGHGKPTANRFRMKRK
ncbi:MAG: MBL fold metallo-hydrolase [Lachnospiraceae bacterium]|nr:MBL fold metallo-hydrolase [Lachnospiraceae bacterium]